MLQLLLLGHCGGSPVSQGRAGGQQCLLWSQTTASFQVTRVCLWLWSNRAASFPLLLQGPAQEDVAVPQVMLWAVLHLQVLFLSLQCFRWCIYWQAQCGALAFPDHCFCCCFQAIISRQVLMLLVRVTSGAESSRVPGPPAVQVLHRRQVHFTESQNSRGWKGPLWVI